MSEQQSSVEEYCPPITPRIQFFEPGYNKDAPQNYKTTVTFATSGRVSPTPLVIKLSNSGSKSLDGANADGESNLSNAELQPNKIASDEVMPTNNNNQSETTTTEAAIDALLQQDVSTNEISDEKIASPEVEMMEQENGNLKDEETNADQSVQEAKTTEELLLESMKENYVEEEIKATDLETQESAFDASYLQDSDKHAESDQIAILNQGNKVDTEEQERSLNEDKVKDGLAPTPDEEQLDENTSDLQAQEATENSGVDQNPDATILDVEQDEQTEVSQDQDEAEKTTEEDNDEKKNLIDTPKLPKLTMFDIIKRDYQALFGRSSQSEATSKSTESAQTADQTENEESANKYVSFPKFGTARDVPHDFQQNANEEAKLLEDGNGREVPQQSQTSFIGGLKSWFGGSQKQQNVANMSAVETKAVDNTDVTKSDDNDAPTATNDVDGAAETKTIVGVIGTNAADDVSVKNDGHDVTNANDVDDGQKETQASENQAKNLDEDKNPKPKMLFMDVIKSDYKSLFGRSQKSSTNPSKTEKQATSATEASENQASSTDTNQTSDVIKTTDENQANPGSNQTISVIKNTNEDQTRNADASSNAEDTATRNQNISLEAGSNKFDEKKTNKETLVEAQEELISPIDAKAAHFARSESSYQSNDDTSQQSAEIEQNLKEQEQPSIAAEKPNDPLVATDACREEIDEPLLASEETASSQSREKLSIFEVIKSDYRQLFGRSDK